MIITIRTFNVSTSNGDRMVSARGFMPSGQQLVECSIVGAPSGGESILKAQTRVYEWVKRERPAYTIEIDPEIHVPRSIT